MSPREKSARGTRRRPGSEAAGSAGGAARDTQTRDAPTRDTPTQIGAFYGGRLQTSRGLTRSSWRYAARRAWHGFLRHRGIDSAAALTFFSTLTLFPASLVVVSSFAVVRNRDHAVDSILAVVREFSTDATATSLEAPLHSLLSIENPGIALGVGLLLTLWSLSAYSTAFGRALNSVYEVQEGRQFWKFRGLMMIVTVFLMGTFGTILTILVTTPRVSSAIALNFGIAVGWVTAWNILKWPVLAVLAVVVVAVLYYFTPNVRHLRVRWVTWGAIFAIVVWSLATVGFAVYVNTIGQYERVYGWIGGGIVLLLWLYITNLVLVIGAEVDAELVRLRQLAAGVHAEGVIQLPMRDTTRNLLLARQRARDETEGRAIREAAEAARIEPL